MDGGATARTAVPAPALVLGAVVSVQAGAAIAVRLFPVVGPGGAVLLRIVIAAVLLVVVARPRRGSADRRNFAEAVLFGLTLAAMNATFYAALDRVPLGVGVTVEFVGPLAVAISGSRRRLDLVWAALAAAGVVLLASGGGRVGVVGVGLALVAGGFWAAYILLAQRVGRSFPGASGLAIALTVAAVAVAPLGIVAAGTKLLRPSVLWRGAVVALLSSALPYSLELFALQRMRASVFGVLMSLEPAVAAVSGLVLLSQHLVAREWVAIGCVVIASVGATRDIRREDVPVEPGATPTEVVA